MTALWLGWTAIVLVLCIGGKLIDKQLDRGHEIRWQERFYQPQLPVRRGRIIDVETRNVPLPGDRGTYGGHAVRVRHPRYQVDYVKNASGGRGC